MTSQERVVHQPIHPDVLGRLDPEYVAFHNANTAYAVPVQLLPWNPAVRQGPPVPGGAEPLKVGAIKDISLSKCAARVYTPEGTAPDAGWPVLLSFHGGGWTLGGINTETSWCTNACQRARCVVVSVDYRLAPENPYPAAVEDAVEALHWVYQNGKSELNVDITKYAVGGSSSGGNLAAVVALKAALAEPPIPLVLQQLFVPVVDNTATTSGDPYKSWAENINTPALTPGRMLWFRDNYLPNQEDRTKWDSSPIFAPNEAFKRAAKAYIAVMDIDILRDEGVAYGEKLRNAGVEVEIKSYKGVPHPALAMDATNPAMQGTAGWEADCH
ncbi:lipase/ esterase [Wolfiporia cocos MD-104 SS10]|uniref:Lipase/ esterase n=1 Tax=Wolfiporia cocos (strain MD-104) TaxID=742152 RepID=A0A2H3J1L9_WOLCO|nr:lipase/ esterase [Wolfiporia cocos MD-104 SS10]